MAITRGINVKALLLILSLALLSFGSEAAFRGRSGRRVARPHPRPRHGIAGPPFTIFNVRRFGAKPDGRTDNAQPLMKAWIAACHWRGNARLVIPLGRYLTGPVTFAGPCSNPTPIVVQVMGTVIASTDISEYSSAEWVTFEHLNGLVVTGGGTFDGQGAAVWKYNDCHNHANCQLLPTSIKFNSVTNGIVRQIKSVNSKSFHMAITNCQNFNAHHLHITAPGESPNTDGIHISSSSAVRVSRAAIGTGDDCISIGQGATNISIYKVTCGPGHGISVGSLGKYSNEKDVRGISVKNCTLSNTDNGVRIKTWPGSPPSQASSFYFEDIVMNNVKNPIIIDQQYCAKSSCDSKPSRVKVSDVHYKNIRGTSASNVAVKIMCSQQFPCQNVQLFNINLKYNGYKQKGLSTTASCSNAKLGFGGIQNPPPCR
ncbi:hypothetical protein HHK36_026377 [Tetracentron sinense]|uniref:Exopolygalacturonase-like n=1 Tax=Tetracentron sinense TaxID=13715 RepID=A0A835D261_TETSI|nr:hypothetical protein HHK36_026377 [Tetracentron sinense]